MKNRSLTLLALAGSTLALTACVGTDAGMYKPAPTNSLSRYVLQVEPDLDRIALAVRENGLSDNQRVAVAQLAQRYRASEQSGLTVELPEGDDPVARRSAESVVQALYAAGISPRHIQFTTYAAPDVRAPVVAGFASIRAAVPRCGAEWGNLSRTGENAAASNFGCAVNANLAAQIAEPRDIVQPRTMTPPNAQRRTVVFEAYRQGQPTSAQREPMLESSRISEAVN